MEIDFDKEIDTLMRKAHRDPPDLSGESASRHLDADEISAFAENAMPEGSRALYSVHLADCDRCRKILSNLLVMNAEALPAATSPSVITIAERALPWHKRLLLFPNLAYLMGSLVLVFAGFLGYTIIRNTGAGDAMVSQIADSESTRGGPNFQNEPVPSTGVEDSSNMSANAAANTTSGTFGANQNASRDLMGSPGENGPSANRTDNNFALDGVTSTDSAVAASPPPSPPMASAEEARPLKDMAPARERDELAKGKTEDKVGVATGGRLQEQAKSDLALKNAPGAVSQTQNQTQNTQSGPMNRNERGYDRQLENPERRSMAKRAEPRDKEGASGRKLVGGRTFERKENVWYDTAYQGRPTINVRRGSAEFNRLDGGLRSIANSLSGTIVVVWGAKAYRIQ